MIVWGGEFGRTIYAQSPEKTAGAIIIRVASVTCSPGRSEIRPGAWWTDDYSYNIVRDPVYVHDLNATILHQLGIDHERLTFKFQGRQYRLTDVHGRVVREILAQFFDSGLRRTPPIFSGISGLARPCFFVTRNTKLFASVSSGCRM